MAPARLSKAQNIYIIIVIINYLISPLGCSNGGNAYRLWVGKPEGKRPLGRPRRRSVDNIKMDLLEIDWGGVDWIGLAQDRDKWRVLVNAVMNFRFP
jgi:hypothetical protein